MLCIVIGKDRNEKYFKQDEEKNGSVWRENNVNMVFGFHLILECMECGGDWKLNNVSVNVESLYSTPEIIQQRRKEGRKCLFTCFCCLLGIIHRDSIAQQCTDY